MFPGDTWRGKYSESDIHTAKLSLPFMFSKHYHWVDEVDIFLHGPSCIKDDVFLTVTLQPQPDNDERIEVLAACGKTMKEFE